MVFVKWFVRVFAFVACVVLCNLGALIKAQPAEKGQGYFDNRKNLVRHLVFSAVGIWLGILFMFFSWR